MKYLTCLLLLLFSTSAYSQCEEQVKALERQVSRLKDEMLALTEELMACRQHQPIFPENFFEKIDENNQEKERDLEEEVQVAIKNLNRRNEKIAREIDKNTSATIEYIEALRKKLVRELCGEGCVELQKKHFQDRTTANRVMLDEGEGKKLKAELERLFRFFINYNIQPETLEIYKPLHPKLADGRSWEEHGKTWEEFKFRNMPPAAIFPLLSQMQNSIRLDELVVIESLKK